MGMNRGILVGLVLFLTATASLAQVNRYVVHFTDKNASTYSLENPIEFLSQKAIDRRTKQNISITEEDFPVNSSYIQGVKDLGVDTYYSSRWFNAVLVEMESSNIPAVEALSYVGDVEFVAPGAKLSIIGGAGKSGSYHSRRKARKTSEIQNEMLGVDAMHDQGFIGTGMAIAVFDGGFDNVDNLEFFTHLFDNSKVGFTFDYIANDVDPYKYDNHGTEVLSCIAAFDEDDLIGTAYDANVMLCVTEDITSEYRVEEYNWLFAAEKVDSAGADIITTSLGYNTFTDDDMNYGIGDLDGETALITLAAEKAFTKGILVVSSAGNEGNKSWQFVTPPADGKNILAIGAVDATKARAAFSSIGPTADGRIKPDLMAMGQGTTVGNSDGSFITVNGTSFAAPLFAGFAAGVWQALPDLTNVELFERLRNSGNRAFDPNEFVGYGIPDFSRALDGEMVTSVGENLGKDDKYVVFPNPVRDNQVFIKLNDRSVVNDLEVSVYNSRGRLVKKEKLEFNVNASITTLDISRIKQGFYFLNITAGNHTQSIKLLKE